MSKTARWFIQSVSGLLMTGAGLCMTVDAGFNRFKGEEWFWYGTLALIIFQAGICLIVDGLRYRIKN